jgi:hypothetical protein
VTSIESLLAEVASEWSNAHQPKITLRLIGAGALMLQTGYDRGTKDSDILESEDLDTLTHAQLLELAGPVWGEARADCCEGGAEGELRYLVWLGANELDNPDALFFTAASWLVVHASAGSFSPRWEES